VDDLLKHSWIPSRFVRDNQIREEYSKKIVKFVKYDWTIGRDFVDWYFSDMKRVLLFNQSHRFVFTYAFQEFELYDKKGNILFEVDL
jgi:hypothetical protein